MPTLWHITMTLNSAIYRGHVRHRRFSPKKHQFSYSMYMLALDLDELEPVANKSIFFNLKKFAPISFYQKDYVIGEPIPLKQRIANKVNQLGADFDGSRVVFMGQCRCFGIYFSPANFYFCYNKQDDARWMLAEVSNTPWNERHYYLVDLKGELKNDKVFHVSPFMELAMQYHWRVKPPQKDVLIHIENHKDGKVFDATLAMKKQTFNQKNLFKTWLSFPLMTGKVVLGIYWQAMKLFIKRVPFIAHPER